MASDILLDADRDDWATVDAAVLFAKGSDLILEEQKYRSDGRSSGVGPYRRALVHTEDDGLAVNFDDDYPGGTYIRGARLRLRVESEPLPKDGALGDLVLTFKKDIASITGGRTTLWLCVGTKRQIVGGSVAVWAPIELGNTTDGSA